jgi:molecular chaperone GrpE
MAQEETINPQNESVEDQKEVQIEEQEIEESAETLTTEEKLMNDLAEQKDKYLRLYSEFENFRKRTAKERIDLISTASEGLILSILPVLDDFERAEKAMATAAEVAPVLEGIALIKDKFVKILSNKGLEPIEAQNQVFDTELHEAITQIPSPTPDMKGKVIDCVEKGYKLGDKVIRYSKVVIGN